jgi:hypothetical protein
MPNDEIKRAVSADCLDSDAQGGPPLCAGCEAICAALDIVPEPDSWWLPQRRRDQRAAERVVYVIAGGAIHLVEGRCDPKDRQKPDDDQSGKAVYKSVYLTPADTFTCSATHTMVADAGKDKMRWEFVIGASRTAITISIATNEPSDEQAGAFALALRDLVASVKQDRGGVGR